MSKPTILYITDLYYPAKSRNYYTEDIYITSHLKDEFDIAICNPLHSLQFEKKVDMIVIRNSGPVIYYKKYFDDFFSRVNKENILTYNSFDGKGDMLGKQYLLTLTAENYPVIPTIDELDKLEILSNVEKYIVKPKEGADSIGMEVKTLRDIQTMKLDNYIIQPYIDFIYEVSFYFIDNVFQYALYAPDKNQRWKLEEYSSSQEDLAFAQTFVQWNNMTHGIQRVDACRTTEGNLLLVELEDLNPFLSIDLLDDVRRQDFINNFKSSLKKTIENNK